jgi:hypothetical protein
MKTTDTGSLPEIVRVCEQLLYHEINLIINKDNLLPFERNTRKLIYEYPLEILEASGKLMTVDEITLAVQKKYSDLDVTPNSIRASLGDRDHFLFVGRSSTYGLKRWENEYEYLRGGTIRQLAQEYLEKFDEPKKIKEIAVHISKFRAETYERSILDNLKALPGKFVFFRGAYVGLRSKNYLEAYIALGKNITLKGWEDRYKHLKLFREETSKWPQRNSKDLLERILAIFCDRCKRAFSKGQLDDEKVKLLNEIQYPLQDYKVRKDNWFESYNKLSLFLEMRAKWPRPYSEEREERVLYNFCRSNREKAKKSLLDEGKVEKLKNLQFKF